MLRGIVLTIKGRGGGGKGDRGGKGRDPCVWVTPPPWDWILDKTLVVILIFVWSLRLSETIKVDLILAWINCQMTREGFILVTFAYYVVTQIEFLTIICHFDALCVRIVNQKLSKSQNFDHQSVTWSTAPSSLRILQTSVIESWQLQSQRLSRCTASRDLWVWGIGNNHKFGIPRLACLLCNIHEALDTIKVGALY